MTAEPETPVAVLNGSPTAPFLFVCEHACARIPERFNGLGLDEATQVSHIAWDPGAEAVTRRLGEFFDSPVVLGRISRLVYDCNRPPESPDAIPERSEIFDVPGNCNLTAEQKSERVETVYRPFERTVAKALDAQQIPPALVTVHSFTPVYFGRPRDVEIGILHDDDSRLADVILGIADRHTTLDVRRNEPYGPDDGVTHTLRRHGLTRGLLNVMIEVRNDLLKSDADCNEIAALLARLLRAAHYGQAMQVPAMGVTA